MGLDAHTMGVRFWSLIGAVFLGFLGMGTVLPRLGPHVRYDLGGTDQTVGLVIGVFYFFALISRFVSGPLADERGRKIAFLVGLSSCGLAGVAYLLPLGLPGAYLGRIFQGFGEACLYTGAAAWAVEMAGIERSSRALGYVSTGIWGGISAGPVVGAWVGSFESAAACQIVAAIASMALLWQIPEHYTPHPNPGRRPPIARSLAPGIAIGFVNVHYPVITGFLILHLAQHGNSGPAAFSAYAGTILLSRFFLGGLPDRMAPHITFYWGLAAMACGLTVLALGPGPVIAVVATAVLGFGFSFPWASIASTVLKRTPSHERGSAVGILSAYYDVFVGISSFAAGAMAKRFGYPAAFAMAVVALAGAVVAGRFVFFPRASEPVEPEVLAAESR